MSRDVIRHAARDNGVRYWFTLSWNTVGYYARMHRWAALARATWLVIGTGYYLEVCQQCGRRVDVVWYADDDLYQRATGAGRAGIFCPRCFGELAEQATGDYIVWRPLPSAVADAWWAS